MEHIHNHSQEHSSHGDGVGIKTHYSIKDFLPLITVFVVVILITWFLTARGGTADTFSIFRNFMGVFFLVFGAFKVANLKGFADAYSVYDVIAKRVRAYGYVYPFIELALGLAYIFSFELFLTSWVTLIVMLVSAVGVWNELRAKNQIPCACLGVVFKIPMTWVTLFEDLLMAAMALVMIFMLS